MPHDDHQQKWELSTLQRGLIDNCFEEGQYETAIATLDQLRSSEFNPWKYVCTFSDLSLTLTILALIYDS